MRSTQRPDTLAQDQYYSILTDFSSPFPVLYGVLLGAPPVHSSLADILST